MSLQEINFLLRIFSIDYIKKITNKLGNFTDANELDNIINELIFTLSRTSKNISNETARTIIVSIEKLKNSNTMTCMDKLNYITSMDKLNYITCEEYDTDSITYDLNDGIGKSNIGKSDKKTFLKLSDMEWKDITSLETCYGSCIELFDEFSSDDDRWTNLENVLLLDVNNEFLLYMFRTKWPIILCANQHLLMPEFHVILEHCQSETIALEIFTFIFANKKKQKTKPKDSSLDFNLNRLTTMMSVDVNEKINELTQQLLQNIKTEQFQVKKETFHAFIATAAEAVIYKPKMSIINLFLTVYESVNEVEMKLCILRKLSDVLAECAYRFRHNLDSISHDPCWYYRMVKIVSEESILISPRYKKQIYEYMSIIDVYISAFNPGHELPAWCSVSTKESNSNDSDDELSEDGDCDTQSIASENENKNENKNEIENENENTFKINKMKIVTLPSGLCLQLRGGGRDNWGGFRGWSFSKKEVVLEFEQTVNEVWGDFEWHKIRSENHFYNKINDRNGKFKRSTLSNRLHGVYSEATSVTDYIYKAKLKIQEINKANEPSGNEKIVERTKKFVSKLATLLPPMFQSRAPTKLKMDKNEQKTDENETDETKFGLKQWLRDNSLEQYHERLQREKFQETDIDLVVMLSKDDLEKMGISLRDRIAFIKAFEEFKDKSPPKNDMKKQKLNGNNNEKQSQDPSVVYGNELAQLISMGFEDTNENIKAILTAKGDVQLAVNILIAQ